MFYKPLGKSDITRIIDLLIAELNKRLANRQISCSLTPEAKEYVIENGFDPAFGARPLRRFVQHNVETLIGRSIIAEEVAPGDEMMIALSGGRLSVQRKPKITIE